MISESIARRAPAVATRDHSVRGRVDILTWRRSGTHRLDRLHALFGTLLSPPTTTVLSILIQHAIHYLRLVWLPGANLLPCRRFTLRHRPEVIGEHSHR